MHEQQCIFIPESRWYAGFQNLPGAMHWARSTVFSLSFVKVGLCVFVKFGKGCGQTIDLYPFNQNILQN